MNKIYFNGELIDADEAKLGLNDRGLLLADGLFETMMATHGNVAFLSDHWQRLEFSAKILNIPLSIVLADLNLIIQQLLAANNLTREKAIIRLTLTRGPGGRGIIPPADPHPTLLITAMPLKPALISMTVCTIAHIRRNEFSPLANIKSLGYLDNILARQSAIAAGADEALLFNTQGNLACATTANIFLVIADKLITPSLKDGALPGIIRKKILQLAPELALLAIETRVTKEDLFKATEVFLTNSLIGIMPVIKIDSVDFEFGELTQRLQTKFLR